MVDLTIVQKTIKQKEFDYFIKHFKGHTTFASGTREGRFYNHPEAKYAELLELNNKGHSIYFTVNETSKDGRKRSDLKSIRAVFADDDVPREHPKAFPLEPSMVLQTSKHDNKYKHQYYWLTSTEDYDVWERVLLGIIKTYNTDVNVHDPARILRVPSFLNHKYEPPSPCSMLSCSGTVYTWSQITSAFPPLSRAKVVEVKGKSPEGRFNLQEMMSRFRQPTDSGYISNSLNSLISHWAWHYSAIKIDRMVDDLYATIDEDRLAEHSDRYYAARQQVAKWIRSSKKSVFDKQKEEQARMVGGTNVTSYSEMPLDLIWDWSILKSNDFPDECLPKYLFDAASEVGDWNGIGKAPAVLSAMSICSALLNKNVIIHETFDQLTHYCAQGTIIVMDTGASKSSIYEAMNQPFFEYEDSLHKEWESVKSNNMYMVKALEMEIKNADTRYNKGGKEHTETEMIAHAKKQGRLQDRIDVIQVKAPTLHTNDITEEIAFRKMMENNGVISLISDDARKPINILLGEYKKGDATGEAIYISGFSGTSITRERSSGDEQRIKNPALNCLYFVQPDTAIKLRNSEMYVPSGLAARMPMFFYPTDGADIIRNRKRRDIDHQKMSPYYEHLKALCFNRADNPLHIRLTDEGMARCKYFDLEFADMLEGDWHGEFSKLNKFVSTSLQYAVCIAALDDPEFKHKFRHPTDDDNDYYLSIKYMNMGFMYAKVLFQQSVVTQNLVQEDGIPAKAKRLLTRIENFYATNKVYEGFVVQGDFINNVSMSLRQEVPQLVEFLLGKKWLYTTNHIGDKRKLNSGFPNKLVDEGDLVYHLNVKGINKRKAMNLDKIEDRTDG